MPASQIPHNHFLSFISFDKFVHAGLFGMQVILVCLPFFGSGHASARLFLIVTLVAILYGIAMEFVQKYFTTDRDFDIWDMAADAVGALTALVLVNRRYKKFITKKQAAV